MGALAGVVVNISSRSLEAVSFSVNRSSARQPSDSRFLRPLVRPQRLPWRLLAVGDVTLSQWTPLVVDAGASRTSARAGAATPSALATAASVAALIFSWLALCMTASGSTPFFRIRR